MGFLDDVSASLNRGANAGARGAKMIKLKAQIGEVARQRAEFAAQLGAVVYTATKDDPEARAGRETFYAGIEDCDQRTAQLEAEYASLDAEGAAADGQAKSLCPQCGAPISPNDRFCVACGAQLRGDLSASAPAAADDSAAAPKA
jgi:hypothetical protein